MVIEKIKLRNVADFGVDKVHCLKKNQKAPRPSEHPPVKGEKMSKRLA